MFARNFYGVGYFAGVYFSHAVAIAPPPPDTMRASVQGGSYRHALSQLSGTSRTRVYAADGADRAIVQPAAGSWE